MYNREDERRPSGLDHGMASDSEGSDAEMDDGRPALEVTCPECDHVTRIRPPAGSRMTRTAGETERGASMAYTCEGCGRDFNVTAPAGFRLDTGERARQAEAAAVGRTFTRNLHESADARAGRRAAEAARTVGATFAAFYRGAR